MSAWIMLLRKMARNRWLVGSLLVGLVLCTALTSSMSIYKDAIMQRMLIKDLDMHFEESGIHSGMLSMQLRMTAADRETQTSILSWNEQIWKERVEEQSAVSFLSEMTEMETVNFNIVSADPQRAASDQARRASLAFRTALDGKVDMIDGKFPEGVTESGAYEAAVIDSMLVTLKMLVGQEYIVDDMFVDEPIRIKIVGVMKEKPEESLYWNRKNLSAFRSTFFVDEQVFRDHILEQGKVIMSRVEREAIADYRSFSLEAAASFAEMRSNLSADSLSKYTASSSSQVWMPASQALGQYESREQILRSVLLALNVPLYILFAFYLYMVSNLLIERQRSEIAVLRSRGAGRRQVAALFAVEYALLSAVAIAVGPLLGSLLTRVLGSTTGFMTFVQREKLDIHITSEAYLYAAVAGACAFVINMAPVVLAARFSIVEQKRQKARGEGRQVWQWAGLDIILIGVSIYALFGFRKELDDRIKHALDGSDLTVDPLLFAVPSIFILGVGLLLLRLYPWVIRLVYRLGRSLWSPAVYSTLLLAGRRGRLYHPLMMFLVITVGTGLFNASAARTINVNLEEQIRYATGADLIVQQQWQTAESSTAAARGPAQGGAGAAEQTSSPAKLLYVEPPFELFDRLPGVEHAARVYTQDNAYAYGVPPASASSVKLIGIHTEDFGHASWMKDDLLPHHYYEYLNLIAGDPQSVLISASIAEKLSVKEGDVIRIGWPGLNGMMVRVYGIVDYFPTFNPNPVQDSGRGGTAEPGLIVAHLSTVQQQLALEPYEVWMKLESDDYGLRETLFAEMASRGISFISYTDTNGELVDSRQDPLRMAMNGVMSLGFIVALVVTLCGFLLYWILSLQSRMLQYGIFRAMGISFRQLLRMLSVEQLLSSGAGILFAGLAGAAAASLFVPMFQLAFAPGEIVPPYEVQIDARDIILLTALTLAMLVAALAALGLQLKRMKINQAVKLGED